MEQKFDYVLFEGLLRIKSDTVTNVDQLFSILNQRNQLSWICLFSHILLPTSRTEYDPKQRCNIFL